MKTMNKRNSVIATVVGVFSAFTLTANELDNKAYTGNSDVVISTIVNSNLYPSYTLNPLFPTHQSCQRGYVKNINNAKCSWCMPDELQERLNEVWVATRPVIEAKIESLTENPSSTTLYAVEVFLHNLLLLSSECGDHNRIHEIAQVIDAAFEHLVEKDGFFTWVDNNGQELNTLSISQFLAMTTQAINTITSIPEEKRTDPMNSLLDRSTVVLIDHYRRWILDNNDARFNTHALGCDGHAPLHPHSAFTLSAWFKTHDPEGWIIGTGGTSYVLQLTEGKLAGRIITDEPSLTEPEYTIYEFSGVNLANDDIWHHAALSFDSDNGLARLYLDGVFQQKIETKGRLRRGHGPIYFGGYNWGDGQCCFLNGEIDEGRLFAQALDSEEVSKLASCKDLGACLAEKLVAYWNFEAGGNDVVGPHDLETLPLMGLSEIGDLEVNGSQFAQYFDGVDNFAVTHNWNGPQTHWWNLRGKAWDLLRDHEDDRNTCRAVLDTDMWIIIGVLEMLAAIEMEPEIVSISASDLNLLHSHVAFAYDLIKERLQRTKLLNWNGDTRYGMVFDPGVWDDHSGHSYSAYTGMLYPDDSAESPNKEVSLPTSWDLSHGQRLVHVFASLRRNKQLIGKKFPSKNIMKRLANQFAYGSFNGDLGMPLFHNFMDGTDGWYRVGYNGQDGFGYGPGDFSVAGMNGGYGFWKNYNADIVRINRSLLKMIDAENGPLFDLRQDRYDRYWVDYERGGNGIDVNWEDADGSLDLLQFLPTLGAGPW